VATIRGLGLRVKSPGWKAYGLRPRGLSQDLMVISLWLRAQAGEFERFHERNAARSPFLAADTGAKLPESGAKSSAFSAHSRFSPALFCPAHGVAGLAKKVSRQSLFVRPWRARPSPAHTSRRRRAPKPSKITHGLSTRTVLCRGASALRPSLLYSAPKSGAKSGAKVWILKVWSKV
jgi:hypothetical protein